MKYLCWWSFVLGNQVHSQQLSDAKLCLFNVNQKRAFEQIVKLLEIYNEHCVWMECRKCPFHRYWILIIPWFLNKQTDCITFAMNIVVVLKKLLNKQVSFLNKKSEFVWTLNKHNFASLSCCEWTWFPRTNDHQHRYFMGGNSTVCSRACSG